MNTFNSHNSKRTDLFDAVSVASIEMKNRIVMAPVTRSRYEEDGIPNELHATYYAQRAGAGMIVARPPTSLPRVAATLLRLASGAKGRLQAGRRLPMRCMRPAARS
ncbi:hypothetical protein ACLB90_19625 [Stenotrophomonas sp. LGBM10]|uniref:oxidoreductase n=1 Tax=Stenotrophomonas sp. LGBM10 TaxID=3390038 RepID=UPI00398B404C